MHRDGVTREAPHLGSQIRVWGRCEQRLHLAARRKSLIYDTYVSRASETNSEAGIPGNKPYLPGSQALGQQHQLRGRPQAARISSAPLGSSHLGQKRGLTEKNCPRSARGQRAERWESPCSVTNGGNQGKHPVLSLALIQRLFWNI